METSQDVIDAARAALGNVSQYRLAKESGISYQYINRVSKGRQPLGDGMAEKLGEIIGCEPALLIAIANKERAKNERLRESWQTVIERMALPVFACVFFTSSALYSPAASAGFNSTLNGGLNGLFVNHAIHYATFRELVKYALVRIFTTPRLRQWIAGRKVRASQGSTITTTGA